MPPAHDVLDLVRLESLVQEIGDADLVRQAVRAFLDELPDRLAGIRAALASGEPGLLGAAAHALGSPAAMLGAVDVAASARALQDAAPVASADQTQALAAEVEAAARRTTEAMLAYLAPGVTA